MLNNKVILVTGIASQRSIAYSIAKQLSDSGASLILTCQTSKLAERVREFTSDLNVLDIQICDASSESDINNLFQHVSSSHQALHGLVHAIAYAPSDQLKGDFHEVINKEGFSVAHEVSSYSLCLMTKVFFPLLEKGQGSVVTLSYLGSERFVPNYNVMGLAKASLEAAVRYLAASVGQNKVRVNAISAGPIRTLAASGISGFKKMLDNCASQSMLKRNVEAIEVGNVALFLLSDLSSAMTGEVLYVDCGFSKTAMVFS